MHYILINPTCIGVCVKLHCKLMILPAPVQMNVEEERQRQGVCVVGLHHGVSGKGHWACYMDEAGFKRPLHLWQSGVDVCSCCEALLDMAP